MQIINSIAQFIFVVNSARLIFQQKEKLGREKELIVMNENALSLSFQLSHSLSISLIVSLSDAVPGG